MKPLREIPVDSITMSKDFRYCDMHPTTAYNFRKYQYCFRCEQKFQAIKKRMEEK